MAKKFNITGLCIPERHYMVDISGRVAEIRQMVEDGEYFTINRPRQYGKTTTLNCLSRALAGEYTVIKTSFEGLGDSMFDAEENFCSQIFEIFAYNMEFTDEALSERLLHYQKEYLRPIINGRGFALVEPVAGVLYFERSKGCHQQHA
jgi:hypothetical protein